MQRGVSEAGSCAYPCRIIYISPGDVGTVQHADIVFSESRGRKRRADRDALHVVLSICVQCAVAVDNAVASQRIAELWSGKRVIDACLDAGLGLIAAPAIVGTV